MFDNDCNDMIDAVTLEPIRNTGIRLQSEGWIEENGVRKHGRCYDATTLTNIRDKRAPISRQPFTAKDIERIHAFDYDRLMKELHQGYGNGIVRGGKKRTNKKRKTKKSRINGRKRVNSKKNKKRNIR